ncbi:MAG: peroxiredoxin [Betaproteobacteria bacterium]|nr:peroxiredoxin [Betaproteobacteria bacterium]MDH5222008.1 peroxiredoxin [Betaproteobacteria bacterium]MDH5351847.1 peroxiredoxin [Betaproteobacteria bacterium]
MTIKVGDRVPDATLFESIGYSDENHCPVRPGQISVAEQLKGKRVAVFGLPGAFTPTCSGKHLPGYLANYDRFKSKKVDEIWCVAVNDGYVMAVWGRDQKADGKIRMLGDGNGQWTKALGLELDSSAGGMGLRMRRCSMLLDDGVVKQLNVEAPGKFEVSDADTLLKQLA